VNRNTIPPGSVSGGTIVDDPTRVVNSRLSILQTAAKPPLPQGSGGLCAHGDSIREATKIRDRSAGG
jgi:hypothetical protein